MTALTTGTKKRLIIAASSLLTLCIATTLVAGVTYGRFGGHTAAYGNTFASGTVSVGSPSVTEACTVPVALPGLTTSTATLKSALIATSNYTSLTVTPLAKAVALNDKLLIGQGTTTELVTASAAAGVNATSITVTSFTANAAYAAGVMVTDLTTQNSACTFNITYTGNVSGDVAADILVVGGTVSPSTSALWNNASTGLQLVVTDGSSNVYTVPSATLTCSTVATADPQFGSSASNGVTCGELSNDVLTTSGVSASTSFTLSLNWALPVTSPTTAQGGTARIFVSFHAVQKGNDAMDCTPGPATGTVGVPCTPTGTFGWK